MDIKKFEALLRSVDCGSLSRAAQDMGYTQSGLSHMIKSLETRFGFALLKRTRDGVALTENGEKLLPHIRALVNASIALEQDISEINGLVAGTLTIGTFASMSIAWLPHIIKSLHTDYPGIQFHLMEASTQELEKLLQDERIDCAFFSLQPHMRFEWISLYQDPLYAILPLDHPYAERDSFPMEAFRNEPFVIPSMGAEYDTMRVLKDTGIPPECAYSTMEDYAAIAMVENGLCISLIPGLVLRGHRANVAILELDPPQYRTLGIAFNAFDKLSPAAKKFMIYATRIVPQLYGETIM
jgi:DNA-binding transcriptional LysR family regulator